MAFSGFVNVAWVSGTAAAWSFPAPLSKGRRTTGGPIDTPSAFFVDK